MIPRVDPELELATAGVVASEVPAADKGVEPSDSMSIASDRPPREQVIEADGPSPLQTRSLFARSRRGDQAAREALVVRFLPLARRLALRYRRRSEPIDDLVQVASLGLVKAIDRFDPDRGLAFSSFAVPTMLGELKRHFRDHAWTVHLPRGLQERVQAVERASQRIASRQGHSPSLAELCRETGLAEEEVLEAVAAGRAYDAISLDATVDDGDDEVRALGERLGCVDERLELVELGVSVAPALAALADRERAILRLRFIEDLTQQEIAERIGCSQMQISRLLRRSLTRLRTVAAQGDQLANRRADTGPANQEPCGGSRLAEDKEVVHGPQ